MSTPIQKQKSYPTYESQHFTATVRQVDGKNRIAISDEKGYSYFLNQKCKTGDNVSVYITNKKPKRSDLQNRYFHEYLSLISLSCGHTVDELKTWVKGKFLSKGITEVFGEKVRKVRSTTELTIGEMKELIDQIENITEIPAPPTELFNQPHTHAEHEKLKADQKSFYQGLRPKNIKLKSHQW